MKNTRTGKASDAPAFTTVEEANEWLARLGDCDRDIEIARERAADARKAADELEAVTTKPLLVEQKAMIHNLEQFARYHHARGGFGDLKTLELPAGFLGFRKSTKTEFILRKVEDVVAAIEGLPRNTKLGKLIAESLDRIIKVTKKPVKSQIRALNLPPEDLAQIGVRVVADEMIFAYSTDKTKAFDLSEEDPDAPGAK